MTELVTPDHYGGHLKKGSRSSKCRLEQNAQPKTAQYERVTLSLGRFRYLKDRSRQGRYLTLFTNNR